MYILFFLNNVLKNIYVDNSWNLKVYFENSDYKKFQKSCLFNYYFLCRKQSDWLKKFVKIRDVSFAGCLLLRTHFLFNVLLPTQTLTDGIFATGAYGVLSKSQIPTILGQEASFSNQCSHDAAEINTWFCVLCRIEGSCWCQTDGANGMPS